MKKKIGEEYSSLALKRFYDNATDNVQSSALVNRALTDKISTETISQKVNNELNSIYVSMSRINSKFNESSKNYSIIKKEILDVLTDYEVALVELSDYYDSKIEELILKKVELESNLIGKVFREENLKREEKDRVKLKDEDLLKMNFMQKSQNIINRAKENKKLNKESITSEDLMKLNDYNELEIEQENKLNNKISKIKENNEINENELLKIENEIKNISKKIKELNDKKRLELEIAMETKEKWISVTLRKPSVWSKAKRFFANKFTTAKVISNTIIVPLKMKVKEFRINELEGLKG